MKKLYLLISLFSAWYYNAQNIAFDKLYSNSDTNNYFLGHYPVVGSDGLDIHWHGGIKLSTGSGTVLQLVNSNVGIGTIAPASKLEVADANGATLSISTAAGSGTANAPLVPRINFLGFQNNLKAIISSIEQTYNSHGSKLTFLVNDGSSANNLTERMSISMNGNVGIGTSNPTEKLEGSLKG